MKKSLLLTMMTLAFLAGGCTAQQRAGVSGDQTKREIYLNLMTDEQAATFREMESEWRDDEQLLSYCQETGVYQAWRGASPERQALIRRRQIEVGMLADEVQMAWGRPAKSEEATTPAERSEGRSRLLWSWDPVSDPEGEMFLRQASILDGRLEWFKDFRDKSLWKKMKFWE